MGAKHSSAPPQSTFLGLVLSDEIPILLRRSRETRRKKKHRIRKQRRTGTRTKFHPQVSFIIDLDLATPFPCRGSATERARLRQCRWFGRRVHCTLHTLFLEKPKRTGYRCPRGGVNVSRELPLDVTFPKYFKIVLFVFNHFSSYNK